MNLADGVAIQRPPHDEAPVQKVAVTLLAEWPAGTFVENLVARADGKLLVAVHSENRLELIDPMRPSAAHDVFAELPGPIAGPAYVDDDLFVNVSAPGQPPGHIFRVDAAGKVEPWVELLDALFLNGSTPFVGRSLLVGDAVRGRLIRVDVERRTQSVWFEDAVLKKVTAEPWLPGVNGIKVFGRHVYFSNTDAAHIGRVAIEADGRAGSVEIVAKSFTCDDFAFDADGSLYGTTHVHNSVTRLSPSGERVVLAGAEEGLAGSTAVAFGRSGADARSLYVTTTGGILAPYEGVVRTAKLLRLDVGAAGHPIVHL